MGSLLLVAVLAAGPGISDEDIVGCWRAEAMESADKKIVAKYIPGVVVFSSEAAFGTTWRRPLGARSVWADGGVLDGAYWFVEKSGDVVIGTVQGYRFAGERVSLKLQKAGVLVGEISTWSCTTDASGADGRYLVRLTRQECTKDVEAELRRIERGTKSIDLR